MGKIIAAEYVTLDGVMEAPAWTGPYFDDQLAELQSQLLFASDALLLGHVTYQGFAASWPHMEETEGEFAVRMNRMPKHVASRIQRQLDWNATVLDGELTRAVTELKQIDVTLLIYGSATLVNALLPHGLIDQYRMMVFPVLVGNGKRLFELGISTTPLRLISAQTTKSGVAVLDYEPA